MRSAFPWCNLDAEHMDGNQRAFSQNGELGHNSKKIISCKIKKRNLCLRAIVNLLEHKRLLELTFF
jgi:hypothetical protein